MKIILLLSSIIFASAYAGDESHGGDVRVCFKNKITKTKVLKKLKNNEDPFTKKSILKNIASIQLLDLYEFGNNNIISDNQLSQFQNHFKLSFPSYNELLNRSGLKFRESLSVPEIDDEGIKEHGTKKCTIIQLAVQRTKAGIVYYNKRLFDLLPMVHQDAFFRHEKLLRYHIANGARDTLEVRSIIGELYQKSFLSLGRYDITQSSLIWQIRSIFKKVKAHSKYIEPILGGFNFMLDDIYLIQALEQTDVFGIYYVVDYGEYHFRLPMRTVIPLKNQFIDFEIKAEDIPAKLKQTERTIHLTPPLWLNTAYRRDFVAVKIPRDWDLTKDYKLDDLSLSSGYTYRVFYHFQEETKEEIERRKKLHLPSGSLFIPNYFSATVGYEDIGLMMDEIGGKVGAANNCGVHLISQSLVKSTNKDKQNYYLRADNLPLGEYRDASEVMVSCGEGSKQYKSLDSFRYKTNDLLEMSHDENTAIVNSVFDFTGLMKDFRNQDQSPVQISGSDNAKDYFSTGMPKKANAYFGGTEKFSGIQYKDQFIIFKAHETEFSFNPDSTVESISAYQISLIDKSEKSLKEVLLAINSNESSIGKKCATDKIQYILDKDQFVCGGPAIKK